MKAAFLHGPRDIRIAEVPEVDAGPDDLLLDVTAVGICGSDLHTYLYGNVGGVGPLEPLILGHEAAGVVAEVGANLEGIFHIGQHVAIDPAIPGFECSGDDGEPAGLGGSVGAERADSGDGVCVFELRWPGVRGERDREHAGRRSELQFGGRESELLDDSGLRAIHGRGREWLWVRQQPG